MPYPHSLFERFISHDNFHSAFVRVAGKNASGGVDAMSVEQFGKDLEKNISRLIDRIQTGTYSPEPVAAVHIPKFNAANEWRELGLPTVADKIVQTALIQAVEPLAEKKFLSNSYGYRPGKGPYKALRRVEHALGNEKRTWVAGHDIDNFFDTLNHERLLRLWAELVSGDSRLVELAALWCGMGIIRRDGRWQNVMAGVRQGQVMAPLFANLYLHEFDLFIVEQGWGYVRYADDFLLLCKDRPEAEAAEQAAREFLAGIHLKLNEASPQISSLEQGFTFLGVTFQGPSRTISSKKTEKMAAKLRWLFSSRENPAVEDLLSKLRSMLDGWQRYYSFLKPDDAFSRLNHEIEAGLVEWLDRHAVNREPLKILTYPLLPVDFSGTRSCLQEAAFSNLLGRYAANTRANRKTKSIDEKITQKKRQYRSREVLTGELFVNTPGAFIGKRGGRVIVRLKQAIIAEIPVIRLKKIVVAGQGVCLSSDVVRLCAEENATISFIDGLGRTYSTAGPPEGAAVELVLLQLRHRDSEKGRHLACMFALGKMKNQLALLKSYMKYKGHGQGAYGREFADCRREMESLIQHAKDLSSPASDAKMDFRQILMGYEGRFAAHYWRLVKLLLPAEADFPGRVGHGAKDLVNALLNYGYGILYNQVFQAIHQIGLNAAAGFLHACQESKASLVYDLVEEFRTTVVDRAVFSLLNRRRNLVMGEDGLLVPEARKTLAQAVLLRLGRMVRSKGKSDTLQRMIHAQAQAVKSCLLGKAAYRPYLSRW